MSPLGKAADLHSQATTSALAVAGGQAELGSHAYIQTFSMPSKKAFDADAASKENKPPAGLALVPTPGRACRKLPADGSKSTVEACHSQHKVEQCKQELALEVQKRVEVEQKLREAQAAVVAPWAAARAHSAHLEMLQHRLQDLESSQDCHKAVCEDRSAWEAEIAELRRAESALRDQLSAADVRIGMYEAEMAHAERGLEYQAFELDEQVLTNCAQELKTAAVQASAQDEVRQLQARCASLSDLMEGNAAEAAKQRERLERANAASLELLESECARRFGLQEDMWEGKIGAAREHWTGCTEALEEQCAELRAALAAELERGQSAEDQQRSGALELASTQRLLDSQAMEIRRRDEELAEVGHRFRSSEEQVCEQALRIQEQLLELERRGASLNAAHQRLSNQERLMEEREGQLAEETSELRERIGALDQRACAALELERRAAEQEQTMAEQERRTSDQAERIAEQERRIAEQERRIAEQEQRIAAQQQEIGEQERRIAEEGQRIAEQQQERAEQERRIAEQERQMAEQQLEISEQERRTAEQERRIAEREKRTCEHEQRIAEQEERIAEQEERISKQAQELEEQALEIGRKISEIEELEDSLEHCKADALVKTSTAEEQTSEIARQATILDDVRQELLAKEQTISEQERLLQEWKQRSADDKRQIEAQRAQLEERDAELVALQKKLEDQERLTEERVALLVEDAANAEDKSVEELQKQIARVRELEGTVAELSSRVHVQDSALQDACQKIRGCEHKVREQAVLIDRQALDISSGRSALEAAEQQLQEAGEAAQRQAARHAEQAQELSSQGMKIANQVREIESQSAELSAKISEIRGLREQLDTLLALEQRSMQREQHLEQLSAQLEARGTELEAALAHAKQLEEAQAEAAGAAASLEAEREEHRARAECLEVELGRAREEARSQLEELAAKQGVATAASKAAAVAALQQQLSAVTARLDEAIQERVRQGARTQALEAQLQAENSRHGKQLTHLHANFTSFRWLLLAEGVLSRRCVSRSVCQQAALLWRASSRQHVLGERFHAWAACLAQGTRRQALASALQDARQAAAERERALRAEVEAAAAEAKKAARESSEVEEFVRQSQELSVTVQQFKQENEVLVVENQSLRDSVSLFEGDLESISDRHAELCGHVNRKQKVRYTMRLKEECSQLRSDLNKARSRIVQLESCRKSEGLFEALASIGSLGYAAGLPEQSPGRAVARSRRGSAESMALQQSPAATPSRGACGWGAAAATPGLTPRRLLAPPSARSQRAAATVEAVREDVIEDMSAAEAARRCRVQERALERVQSDFQHLVSLVQRAVLSDGLGAAGSAEGSFADLLKRLRSLIQASRQDARGGIAALPAVVETQAAVEPAPAPQPHRKSLGGIFDRAMEEEEEEEK